ncbi:MAG TPA: hypothetical protein VHC22_11815 [Pirellulales bacterium]|nr:hypothetical protein [Pirellulales bacterium]
MARMARPIQTLVLLIAALVWPAVPALAQTPPSAPAAPRRPAVQWAPKGAGDPAGPKEEVSAPTPDHNEPEILRSLPRPPDQPGSLFDEAPSFGAPAPDWEHPYFERDPLLDPVDWPAPGWFCQAEVGVIKPHVSIPMMAQFTTALGTPVTVQTNSAHFQWTAAPRVEIGYRLPSGFGEFSLSDRYYNALGNSTVAGPNGPGALHSEFMVNYADLDYASRELTPNTGWGLKFRGGVRTSQTFFGSRLDTSFAGALAGNQLFAERETSRSTGVGPHFGVEVDRRFARPGWSMLANADIAEMFSKVRNTFYGATTVPIPVGGFETFATSSHFIQEIPVLTAQLGLSWQPQRLPNSRFYVGYFGQFWYKFATNSNAGVGPFGTPIETHFDNQGIVLQWSLNL